MAPPPTFFAFQGLDSLSPFMYPQCQSMTGKPKGPPRQKFSVQEDEQLRALVDELGIDSWSEVASRLGTRSARQCRERFKNYLSPNLRNGQWSEDEDRLLAEKFKEFGAKWSIIVGFFPSRSEVNLKNRWTQLQNRGAHDLEQEKRKVILDLNSVIAGIAKAPPQAREPGEAELDPLDWNYSDPGQGFDFLRSGFDDPQYQ
jgi:hypothetical protein